MQNLIGKGHGRADPELSHGRQRDLAGSEQGRLSLQKLLRDGIGLQSHRRALSQEEVALPLGQRAFCQFIALGGFGKVHQAEHSFPGKRNGFSLQIKPDACGINPE